MLSELKTTGSVISSSMLAELPQGKGFSVGHLGLGGYSEIESALQEFAKHRGAMERNWL
jgi:hypothetical protein